MKITMIGLLLEVGGSQRDPVATFAECDANGEPNNGPQIVIPLDGEDAARQLGGMLYRTFRFTIEVEG